MALKPKSNLIAETQLHRCDDGFLLVETEAERYPKRRRHYVQPAGVSVTLCQLCELFQLCSLVAAVACAAPEFGGFLRDPATQLCNAAAEQISPSYPINQK